MQIIDTGSFVQRNRRLSITDDFCQLWLLEQMGSMCCANEVWIGGVNVLCVGVNERVSVLCLVFFPVVSVCGWEWL